MSPLPPSSADRQLSDCIICSNHHLNQDRLVPAGPQVTKRETRTSELGPVVTFKTAKFVFTEAERRGGGEEGRRGKEKRRGGEERRRGEEEGKRI